MPDTKLPNQNQNPQNVVNTPIDDASIDVTTETLADILFGQKLLNKSQYDDIKIKSASKGVSEESVIESMEIVPEAKLAQAKAKLLGIP